MREGISCHWYRKHTPVVSDLPQATDDGPRAEANYDCTPVILMQLEIPAEIEHFIKKDCFYHIDYIISQLMFR